MPGGRGEWPRALASQTAPKRVATHLMASVPLKSISCWSVMSELRSEPSWMAVMRTNSSSMLTIARRSPWHITRIVLRSIIGRGAPCIRSIQCCTCQWREQAGCLARVDVRALFRRAHGSGCVRATRALAKARAAHGERLRARRAEAGFHPQAAP